MRRLTLALAATTALSLAAGAATAQEWMSIDGRQAALERRIDAGIRSGDLTNREAADLRSEFNVLGQLEARYRANGLSEWERNDLDRRFDVLAQRIRLERSDWQERGDRIARDEPRPGWFGGRGWMDERGQWVSIERRKMQLDRRIEQGRQSGQLSRAEAYRLRQQFNDIARVEYRYRRDGLSAREREDLDRRFDQLAAQIRWERRDDDRRYGYNR